MTRRASVIAVLVAVAAIGSATAASIGVGGRTGSPSQRGDRRPATAEVTRETLVDYVDAAGDLGYGEPVPLRYTAPAPDADTNGSAGGAGDNQHLVTWLPGVGATIRRGEGSFRVDDQSIVLLYGDLPVYRTLKVGVTGSDVWQLERNIAALGYRDFTVDRDFTASTEHAVRTWQRDIGLSVTGVVAPGQVIYVTGAIRIAKTVVRVGDPAAGEILDYTGTAREVTVDLPVSQRQYASRGAKPAVTLPDGKVVAGRVDVIVPPPTGGDQIGGGQTIRVIVAIADQGALRSSAQSSVRVRFAAEKRVDVLTVPVVALVALAEGGYGVQVVEGTATRYVAVGTGLFAGGRVEITAGDLTPGMRVVVPE